MINAGEVLGPRLISYHNLYYLTRLMERVRTAILEDRFGDFSEEFKASKEYTDNIKPSDGII